MLMRLEAASVTSSPSTSQIARHSLRNDGRAAPLLRSYGLGLQGSYIIFDMYCRVMRLKRR